MVIPFRWCKYIPVAPRLCRLALVACRGKERQLKPYDPNPKLREGMQYVTASTWSIVGTEGMFVWRLSTLGYLNDWPRRATASSEIQIDK